MVEQRKTQADTSYTLLLSPREKVYFSQARLLHVCRSIYQELRGEGRGSMWNKPKRQREGEGGGASAFFYPLQGMEVWCVCEREEWGREGR